MKSREKILCFLGTVAASMILFEMGYQFNWRAEFPSHVSESVTDALQKISSENNHSNITTFSGPFQPLHPVTVLRVLLVGSEDLSRIGLADPDSIRSRVSPFLTSLSLVGIDIQFESSMINHGSDFSELSHALRATDSNTRSHDIHKVVSEWTTSAHVLPYPVHAIPPLYHMMYLFGSTGNPLGSDDVIEVNGVGSMSYTQLSCQSDTNPCFIDDDSLDALASQFISTIRHWLGLTRKGEDPLSPYEAALLRSRIMRVHLETTLQSLRQIESILSAHAAVAFPESVAQKIMGINNFLISDPKRAALVALECLHSPELVARPFFSNEFTFALYAPLGLPIAFPVFSTILRVLKERRRRIREKIE